MCYPIKSEFFSSRGDSEINKKLHHLSVLRSKKKHAKARKVVNDLFAREGTVSGISKSGNADVCLVYRLIHTPKKRIKTRYERKISEAAKQEVIDLYYNHEVSYSLPDTQYLHLRFMRYMIEETYSKFYVTMSKAARQMKRSKFASLKPLEIRTV